MMRTELLRFNGALERNPAIDAWMKEHAGELPGGFVGSLEILVLARTCQVSAAVKDIRGWRSA
jgi:hypothetical protein